MQPDRFLEILAAYGANPDRWPDSERTAALKMLDESADARAAHMRAQMDDQLLATPPDIIPSSNLTSRILNQIPQPTSTKAWNWRIPDWLTGRSAWPQAATLALAFSLGLGAGLSDFDPLSFAEDSSPLAVQWVMADPGFLTE